MADLVFEPPRKVTVVESIVEQIIQQVQTGQLKPGDKLPSERRLIEMLGVGRSSIREALQGLAAIGLVESRAGQGTFVSHSVARLMPDIENPSLSTTLQRQMRLKLVEARRSVENQVAYFAALRAQEDDLLELRAHLAAYTDFVMQWAFAQASEPNYELHMKLAHMTENPFFVPLVDNLLRTIPQSLRESEYVYLANASGEGMMQQEIDVHQGIVDAVAAGNCVAAQAAMEAHMAFEEELIRRTFALQEDEAHPEAM